LLDSWFVQLSSLMNVDLMPGETDPGNPSIPQQPLHSCLMPRSVSNSTFQMVTNPHEFEIENVR
jgi:DNA polymerase delta subunit 2